MKHFVNLYIFLVLVCNSFNIQAQNQKGIITYKGMINEKFVDSFLTAYQKKERPMAIRQKVVNDFNNAKPEEFILNFKNNESYYYKKPDLEQETYNMGSRAGATPYYVNNATGMIIEMSKYLGNIDHTQLDWEITNKTKKIGEYTCRQAKVNEKLYAWRDGSYFYRTTTAWFTPEIPVNFGPKYYQGLPGLILQIEAKEFTLTAVKINLNPKANKVNLKRVDKDEKIITQEESYKRISELEADRKKRMKANQK